MRQDLWVVPLAGNRIPIPFLTTPADKTFGQFSPDGKWIAHSSDESGRRDVYVQGFAPDRVPATAVGRWPISAAGGDKPRWRRDGQELYYIAPDGKMMAVPVKSGATFEPGVAMPLFGTSVAGRRRSESRVAPVIANDQGARGAGQGRDPLVGERRAQRANP